jgi:hypothetical protein
MQCGEPAASEYCRLLSHNLRALNYTKAHYNTNVRPRLYVGRSCGAREREKA